MTTFEGKRHGVQCTSCNALMTWITDKKPEETMKERDVMCPVCKSVNTIKSTNKESNE